MSAFPAPYVVHRRHGRGPLLLLCEHASNHVPAAYAQLGLSDEDLLRHIAWDPGAAATASVLSERLDAPLVCATLSRLLLDLNRDIAAADSIAVRSEATSIPGNQTLSAAEREHRQQSIYHPFHAAVEAVLAERRSAALPTAVISIHSFTPSYHGVARPWHVGVLSQHDRRLADALLANLRQDQTLCVGDNQPYAPEDGVYHSVGRHGQAHGLPCAMLEIRNDLIADAADQQRWAERLELAITRALASLPVPTQGNSQ